MISDNRRKTKIFNLLHAYNNKNNQANFNLIIEMFKLSDMSGYLKHIIKLIFIETDDTVQ
jgi:hypothetical protein